MPGDVRAVAAGVLARVLGGSTLDGVLAPAAPKVPQRDRPLLAQLCYGTLRLAPRLQALAAQLLDKPLRSRDQDVYALLLLGLYQLHASRIPPHAAVAATVEASRVLQKPWARGLLNAVLRRFQREQQTLLAALPAAAAAAHPEWLYQHMAAQWPQQLAQLVENNNSQPPMTLRVNTLRTTREDCLAALHAAGMDAAPGALCASSIYLAQALPVDDIPGFRDGLLSVQDEAAQLAAVLLDAHAGERILDACAAPGGKSCHMLERQPALAALVAMDSDAERLHKVEQNLLRLSLRATLVHGDASDPATVAAAGSFARILLDAPCSASGVIRRHPDIKLLRKASDLAKFADQQRAILDGCWPSLAPGGTLLYVTCSLFREENSDVIAAFLAANSNAAEEALALPTALDCAHGYQLLPSAGGPDGLYYARLRKAA